LKDDIFRYGQNKKNRSKPSIFFPTAPKWLLYKMKKPVQILLSRNFNRFCNFTIFKRYL